MAEIRRMTDRAAIRSFVEPLAGRFLFELADLDDAAWPHSQYYGIESRERTLAELCLLYAGFDPPNFVATVARDESTMRELVEGVAPLLPPHFTAGVPPKVVPALAKHFNVEQRGVFWRMAVSQNLNFRAVDPQGVETLSDEDEPEISSILSESFERPVHQPLTSQPRPFFGIRSGGRLVSVAGTTFLSRRHGIAAVGPVATRPDYRGRGLATRARARLCVELASLGAVVIGLHVRAANAPAIRCYEKLGFARTWAFESCVVTR